MKKLTIVLVTLILLCIVNRDLFPVDNHSDATNVSLIASFNTLHLGWGEKNYTAVSEILITYDIIGLQEVMKVSGVKALTTELKKLSNQDWDTLISEYPVGSKEYKEYYAYIWKRNKVSLIKSLGYYKEKNQYDFIREPYGAIFKTGNFDFTFVLCHLFFGNNPKCRRAEAEKLSDVYEYFQQINGSEQDVIIAGDFNLPASDEGFLNLLYHKDQIKYNISPEEKTTISKNGLCNSYDNFFTSKYTHEIVFTDVYKQYIIDYPVVKKTISDHLPIYLVIGTNVDDD